MSGIFERLSMQRYTLRTGSGVSTNRITAFDRALIEAGIAQFNLVKISSILPPFCIQESEIKQGKGSLLPTAFSVIYSSSPHDIISASIAIGIPENSEDIGVIMEHSMHESKEITEEIAHSLVEEAMHDRTISLRKIVSLSVECRVVSTEVHCAFAAVSIW